MIRFESIGLKVNENEVNMNKNREDKGINQPFYNIRSSAVKEMMNAKDVRTIIKRLTDVGVPIRSFGSQKIVTHEDLIKGIEGEL